MKRKHKFRKAIVKLRNKNRKIKYFKNNSHQPQVYKIALKNNSHQPQVYKIALKWVKLNNLSGFKQIKVVS
jgi:hypothetical protein